MLLAAWKKALKKSKEPSPCSRSHKRLSTRMARAIRAIRCSRSEDSSREVNSSLTSLPSAFKKTPCRASSFHPLSTARVRNSTANEATLREP